MRRVPETSLPAADSEEELKEVDDSFKGAVKKILQGFVLKKAVSPKKNRSEKSILEYVRITTAYFNEIAKYPLLTEKEEMIVGKELEEGRIDLLRALAELPGFVREFYTLCGQIVLGARSSERIFFSMDSDELTEEQGQKYAHVFLSIFGSEPKELSNLEIRSKTSEILKVFADMPIKLPVIEKAVRRMESRLQNMQELSSHLFSEEARNTFSALEETVGVSFSEFKIVFRNIQENLENLHKARTRMIKANLKLVVPIAKKYKGRCIHFTFMDLVQEGNFGLFNAVDRFQYTKGYKFSTYATRWIQLALQRGIYEKTRLIRLPAHMEEKVRKIFRAGYHLQRLHRRKPKIQEVSHLSRVPVQTIQNLYQMIKPPISLETPIIALSFFNGKDHLELRDVIPSDDPSAFDVTAYRERQEAVAKSLEVLMPNEKEVVLLKFGLHPEMPDKDHTLDEIGKRMGFTRERARQILVKALKKLKKEHTLKLLYQES